MTIEELFGTLQMSVVATWRKHLRSAKYGKHMALDEFYKEMPEKVDDLIEAWMGAHGKKVGAFQNILSSSNMNTLKYLNDLKKVCKDGYGLLGDNQELSGLMDDIVNLINSTLYKVKEMSESNMIDLKDFINESLEDINESIKINDLKKWEEFSIANCPGDIMSRFNANLFYFFNQDKKVWKEMEKEGQLEDFLCQDAWEDWFDDEYFDEDEFEASKRCWQENYDNFFKF